MMQLTIDQATTIANTRVIVFQKPVKTAENSSDLFYHLVFKSNGGLGSITRNERKKLYGFVFGCAGGLQGKIESIGGRGASLQLLVSLNPTQTPADFVRKMKLFTCAWTKRKLNLPDFEWRDVEVSTVSHSQRRRIISSIQSLNFAA